MPGVFAGVGGDFVYIYYGRVIVHDFLYHVSVVTRLYI